ncbi:hypothetical protein XabCFBP2524_16015 [Xanthomonas axonopodis pv. begoniae]|nr:hypothetical protein XabCFBP2524_16015 [Xanthomonas axonopodis pv. begoniae]
MASALLLMALPADASTAHLYASKMMHKSPIEQHDAAPRTRSTSAISVVCATLVFLAHPRSMYETQLLDATSQHDNV